MRKLFQISCLVLFVYVFCNISSCSYPLDGRVVMDSDGNFYRLNKHAGAISADNYYQLVPVDTVQFTVKGFNQNEE